jgi:hypothetical protein
MRRALALEVARLLIYLAELVAVLIGVSLAGPASAGIQAVRASSAAACRPRNRLIHSAVAENPPNALKWSLTSPCNRGS